jgi:hypothetical protein
MEGILRHPLIFAFVLIVSISSAQPELLTDSLSTSQGDFALISEGRIVFVNTKGTLSSVSINDPLNIGGFLIDWTPADNGWEGPGEIRLLKACPDGNLLLIALKVHMPDSLTAGGISMPDPVVLLVCDSEGGNARAVGVTYDSDEPLCFDFTRDSRLVYGARILNCLPAPESYFSLYLGDESSSLRPFDVVDLEEWARFSSNGIVGSYILCNPWSDLIAAGNDPLTTIADMSTFSVVFEDSSLTSPVIEQWVEPDAGLAWRDSTQIVRFSDGTVYENPGDPVDVLCRLSDGSFVFSADGGETINRGRINWSTFALENSSQLSELAGYLTPGNRVLAQNSTPAIVFNAGRGLYYYRLP